MAMGKGMLFFRAHATFSPAPIFVKSWPEEPREGVYLYVMLKNSHHEAAQNAFLRSLWAWPLVMPIRSSLYHFTLRSGANAKALAPNRAPLFHPISCLPRGFRGA